MIFVEDIYDNFVQDFSTILRGKIQDLEISKLIFLCIGTDKIVGDSFGPLVGYKLKWLFRKESNIEIIGDLNNLVCGYNINGIIESINSTYEEPFIVAIDAALSSKNNIGRIIVSKDKINIGSGLNKKNIYVGNMSIKGIVAKNFREPKRNFILLQNTPLSLIMNMADCVANGISNVINV